MGLSYVYKRFTPQDFAVIPFNAHKQYNFTSASAAEFSVNHYSSSYTSESVSIYSSASSNPLGVFDSINNIKYNQVDHLFYRNYKKNPSRKKDLTNHNKQRRDLYEKANILSIPSGLYGYQVRKGSFYLSSSTHEIVDDSFGNLLISGTNVSNYPIDPQENVFRLGPVKGFKKYDLSIHDGYAVFNTFYDKYENRLPNQVFNEGTQHIQPHIKNTERKFWRQGQKNAAAFNTYTTNNKLNIYNPYEDLDEDDSYFSTPLQYNNVTFKKSSLGNTNHKFPTINFNSATSSFIKINETPRLNFNAQEEFCISFYIKPDATGSQNDISDSEKRYILAKSTTKTIPGSGNLSGSNSNLIDTSAGPQYPFEIYLQSQSLYFARSDGDTTNIINGEITASGGTCQRTSHILCQLSSSKIQIWFDGTKIAETTNTLIKSTKNKANLYIGSKGPTTSTDDQNTNITSSHHFNGELGNINIWNRAFNTNTIKKISSSVNASPYRRYVL